MCYPNLIAALRYSGIKNYEVARAVGLSESEFSRRMNRRSDADFSIGQRAEVARLLGLAEAWLFARELSASAKAPDTSQEAVANANSVSPTSESAEKAGATL